MDRDRVVVLITWPLFTVAIVMAVACVVQDQLVAAAVLGLVAAVSFHVSRRASACVD